MRSVAICLSMLQAPRGGIHGLANFCWESFHSLSGRRVNSSSFKLLASKTYGLEGGYSRRWIRRPVTTKIDGRNKTNRNTKPSNLVHEILDEKVSTSSSTLNLNKTEVSESQQLQYSGIQQMIAENKDLASLVTFIIYDTETSGLSRKEDRIIEIALQDLSGGENSTFQTLVGSNLPSGTSLQALREHYKIPLVGSAHRAMSDVRTLSLVLQMLTFDLKLSPSNLVTRSSTVLEYINNKRKKNSG
ncbi:DNA polymerase III polC-type, putative isoform 2 [Theobroma cacao]|uniref:DNA polymerase III polC-type, putative isoform 2 n=1 Tax=Theobroma cacao TaxID=3641 RepID=A0A061F3I0_THECC|nr:DNA polymerase III polC-type, putative isoform 2 [Theobroma cacao]